jgi:hypothetical protein
VATLARWLDEGGFEILSMVDIEVTRAGDRHLHELGAPGRSTMWPISAKNPPRSASGS